MSIVLYVTLAIILVIIVLGLIAPKSYEINRSISINKPLPEVFSYLNSLKNQENWSPWAEKDPAMAKTFKGTDGEIGGVFAWKGNKEVGEGEQEIMNIVENKFIESQLRFLKPFRSTSDAYLRVNEDGEGTKVTWGFSGKNKFPINIIMLFMNMDKAVGKDFEAGLLKLKNMLENNLI